MWDFILRYWVEVVFSGVLFLFGLGFKKFNRKLKEQEAIKGGVQAILRDRIISSYNQYMEKGYCPIYARDNVTKLYEQYHNLGGNGTVTHLVEELENLPTDKRG